MRIMRIESVLVEDAPCPPESFDSSCCTRDSSLWIVSRSASTVSSVIGAIAIDLMSQQPVSNRLKADPR